MNLVWHAQSKWYADQVEDPKFFKEFGWINYDLGLKDKPVTEYVERYHYVTEDEIAEIEKNILQRKQGDID